MEEKELKYCNQCPNHCPETALKCGRGKEFFSQMQEGNAEAGEELYHRETPHGHKGHHRHGGKPFHKHDFSLTSKKKM